MAETHDAGVDVAVQHARKRLKATDPSPFSDDAFSTLQKKTSEYIRELVAESRRISKRYRATTVSPEYVDLASWHLMASKRTRVSRLLGALGGVFLGVSLSGLILMARVDQVSAVFILLLAVFGILGTTLLALGIGGD